MDVVAAAFEVVDAQDRFEIAEQILLRQELADHVTDHRRAAEAATDQHLETDFAGGVAHQVQADVVHLRRGAILRRAGHGDLELARQERELRDAASPTGGCIRTRDADLRAHPARCRRDDRR